MSNGDPLDGVYQEYEDGIEKSIPRITDGYHKAYQVMTNGNHKGWIFLSHPYTNNRVFFLLTIEYGILCVKRPQEVPEYAELRHDMMMSR